MLKYFSNNISRRKAFSCSSDTNLHRGAVFPIPGCPIKIVEVDRNVTPRHQQLVFSETNWTLFKLFSSHDSWFFVISIPNLHISYVIAGIKFEECALVFFWTEISKKFKRKRRLSAEVIFRLLIQLIWVRFWAVLRMIKRHCCSVSAVAGWNKWHPPSTKQRAVTYVGQNVQLADATKKCWNIYCVEFLAAIEIVCDSGAPNWLDFAHFNYI